MLWGGRRGEVALSSSSSSSRGIAMEYHRSHMFRMCSVFGVCLSRTINVLGDGFAVVITNAINGGGGSGGTKRRLHEDGSRTQRAGGVRVAAVLFGFDRRPTFDGRRRAVRVRCVLAVVGIVGDERRMAHAIREFEGIVDQW